MFGFGGLGCQRLCAKGLRVSSLVFRANRKSRRGSGRVYLGFWAFLFGDAQTRNPQPSLVTPSTLNYRPYEGSTYPCGGLCSLRALTRCRGDVLRCYSSKRGPSSAMPALCECVSRNPKLTLNPKGGSRPRMLRPGESYACMKSHRHCFQGKLRFRVFRVSEYQLEV